MLKPLLPAADKLLVSYSGGKDSLAVLGVCREQRRQVEGFYMFFVPNLDYSRYWCEYAADTFHIKVHQYQHWGTAQLLRNGSFCSPQNVPKLTLKEIEAVAKRDTGIDWIGYGYKSRDSLERRGILSMWPDGIHQVQRRFAPLKDWSEKDVRAYLSRTGIEIPDLSYSRSVGVDLSPESMMYMRENWQNDYERILRVFPHARAQADRALVIRQQKEQGRKKSPNPVV